MSSATSPPKPSIDPYALIRKTALAWQRRERLTLGFIALPPAAALGGLWVIERLPVEVLAAALIALGLFALHLFAIRAAEPAAASRIDRALEGKESFLTLATCQPTEPHPLRSLVEAKAESLGAFAEPRRFVEPIRRAPLARSVLFSTLGFLLLAMTPAELRPLTASESRLVAIARELDAGPDLQDHALARELHDVFHALRDPKLTAAEKKKKIDEALVKLETESRKAEKASGETGSPNETSAKSAGRDGSQREKRSGGGEESQSQEQGLRDQAREELEKIAGSIDRSAAGGESTETGESRKDAAGEKKETGGGIQGPEEKRGATERRNGSEGNRPGEQQAGREQASEGNKPDTAGRESRGSREKSSPGKSPDLAGSRDTQGSGKRPVADSNSPRAERFYTSGEGPQGWRIENGRYVRVRVPDESQPMGATEIVQKPGDAEPETPYGNAPLPGPGSPGEVQEKQPLPLEYRDVLGARS